MSNARKKQRREKPKQADDVLKENYSIVSANSIILSRYSVKCKGRARSNG